MAHGVADTEMIRRQNRQLVLDALRRGGPASRSQVAMATGLSNASLTAIASDLVSEGILAEPAETPTEGKGRGRPAVILAHRREAGYVLLVEIDVNRCRTSLLDYSGVLVDRVESTVGPALFFDIHPAAYFIERIELMLDRNRGIASAIRSISISLQGILGAKGTGLKWSPIPHLAGHDLVGPLQERWELETQLYKRGRLMADGMRWLDPRLSNSAFATIYVGSTIGMGLTWPGINHEDTDVGTEFGHLIHIPNGALCRCGARGCIEAYASDYAVLRAAYSVPEHAPPAGAVPQSDYQQIITRARQGDRNALRAFTMAGQAIGAGVGRLISLFEIDSIVMLGPATAAFDLMKSDIEDAVGQSLMGKMRGLPPIDIVADAGEPIYRGLKMKALTSLDRSFAHRTGAAREAAQ